MKTTVDTLRHKLVALKSAEILLPDRCKSHEELLFEIINELDTIQKKLEKIHRVLGE